MRGSLLDWPHPRAHVDPMEPMTFSDVFSAVILANMLFMTAVYALWRISKNEKDIKAMGLWLLTLAIMALVVFGGRLFD